MMSRNKSRLLSGLSRIFRITNQSSEFLLWFLSSDANGESVFNEKLLITQLTSFRYIFAIAFVTQNSRFTNANVTISCIEFSGLQLLRPPPSYYYCPQCNRKYINRKYMASHMKNECGKPPKYKCVLCSYGSKRKFNLKLHMLRMHDELLYFDLQNRKIDVPGYQIWN